MNKLFATFDPSALGPSLALEQANTVLVTTATADINRTARVLYGKSGSQWFAEFAVWGDAEIDNAVSFGVVTEDASLSTYVGGDANGFGYRVAEGQIHNNGASIASVTAGKKGDIVGIWIQIGDGSSPTVTWLLNGAVIHTQALPDIGPWYLAATISSATADSLRAWINTGQRDFEFPVAGVDGWYEWPVDVPTLRVSMRDYIARPDDAIPNEVWEGRIANDNIEIVQQLTFWQDGGRSTQGSAVNVTLANGDGALDWIVDSDMRDLPAELAWVMQGESVDAADSVAKMIVNDIAVQDDGSVRVAMAGKMAMFDEPLQTRIFPPSADPVVAGKPWPIALGAVRSAEPVLVDPVNRHYVLSDRGLPGWGYIRDMGAPLDPNAIPPGYVIDLDQRGFVLETDAVGKLTADVSSTGGGTLPSLADDIWDEDGSPFSGTTGSAPTGFDVASNAQMGVPGRVIFTSTNLSSQALLGKSAVTCLAGRSYRFRVHVVTVPAVHTYGTPTLSLRTDAGFPLQVWTSPGIYEGVITAPFDFSPRIVLDTALTGSQAVIGDAYLLELPDVYLPSELNAITLTDFVREIVETRFGLPPSAWSRADCEAIDAATGYKGVGFFASNAITVRDALEAVLPAYCACAWLDDDNVLRFTRLTKPEDETPVGYITASDLLSDLQVRPDLAPALSTQINFRKNWSVLSETDFVSDFIVVPMSVRRALSQPFQGIAASAKPLSPSYARAVNAAPQGSLLDDPADAQASIDHVCDYYATLRKSYTTEVSADLNIGLGQVWNLAHPRYGLEAGKNLTVSRISRRVGLETVAITFRG